MFTEQLEAAAVLLVCSLLVVAFASVLGRAMTARPVHWPLIRFARSAMRCAAEQILMMAAMGVTSRHFRSADFSASTKWKRSDSPSITGIRKRRLISDGLVL